VGREIVWAGGGDGGMSEEKRLGEMYYTQAQRSQCADKVTMRR